MNKKLTTALVAGLILPLASMTSSAQATNFGNEGCTPGYWKNHTDNWEEATPGVPVKWIYSSVAGTAFENTTMLEALQGGGGRGLDGARKILLRAAVAAWLNAAHEGLGYPLRRFTDPGMIKDTVNAALDSNDRQTMLDLASYLDDLNNLGCPLN